MKKIPPLLSLLSFLVALCPNSGFAQWSDGRPANAVIGQSDFVSTGAGTPASKLGSPAGIAVDPESGKVFVCNASAVRVLRFSSEAAMGMGDDAEAVFGQPNFNAALSGAADNRFNLPFGLCLDGEGRLWVADTLNNRVLRFDDAVSRVDADPAADLVLGQADFTSNGSATTQSGMDTPRSLAVDPDGNLWVADSGNRRVLLFTADTVENGGNGADADLVLGQEDFLSADYAISADGFGEPAGIAVHSSGPGAPVELWVSDSSGNRVLRFDDAANKANGADADGVLGQADFTSGGSDTTQSGLYSPRRLVISSEGDLWVADRGNNRVLRFVDAGSKADGGPADNVIGQADFVSNAGETSQTGLNQPTGVALDSQGNLFVSDTLNHRVLRYSPDSPPAPFEPASTGTPRPDNLVGEKAKLATQKGDGKYNSTGAGQKIRILKNRWAAKVWFTVQNDGGASGRFQFKANKGSRKVKVKIFLLSGGRTNVTGMTTSGRLYRDVAPGAELRFLAKVRMTSRAGARARRQVYLKTIAADTGAADRAVAKVILRP